MSLINHGYVPENAVDYMKTTSVQCVHVDKVKYPTAEVTLNVNEQMYLLCVGVVDKLPADMVLGWDLPVRNDLINLCDKPTNAVNVIACPVFKLKLRLVCSLCQT